MISSIVLAAGLSTRMGKPKALLDWGGESLISYQVNQLHEAGVGEVIVVLGYRADDISRTMRRLNCRIMLNPRFQHGRAQSLRIGAKAVNRDAESIVIINVDQPRPASFIAGLLAAHKPEAVATQPFHGGHHGHPIVVAGGLRPELMEATDEAGGLIGVLKAHPGQLAEWVVDDDLCHLDLNTPGDYDEARKRFGLES